MYFTVKNARSTISFKQVFPFYIDSAFSAHTASSGMAYVVVRVLSDRYKEQIVRSRVFFDDGAEGLATFAECGTARVGDLVEAGTGLDEPIVLYVQPLREEFRWD
ncbi:hypothetical protein D9619_006303 [Psilocybe cf. subviscida]|uniref:Uncharacterized protein n=1 Tax=Psilocybe cf. subviscida TaxID=2480587 RepID=A0A8H5B4J9_9AGAR|nr:hypothetical protein D9619_006303 [Psilocybe cf. subviscida]